MIVRISPPEVPTPEARLARVQDYTGTVRRPSVIYSTPLSDPTLVKDVGMWEGSTVCQMGNSTVAALLAIFPDAQRVQEIF